MNERATEILVHDGIKKASKIGHFVRYRSADACLYLSTILPPFWRLQRLMDEATTDSVSQFINLFMLLARSSVSALLSLAPFWMLAGGRVLYGSLYFEIPHPAINRRVLHVRTRPQSKVTRCRTRRNSPRLGIFVPKSATVGWKLAAGII